MTPEQIFTVLFPTTMLGLGLWFGYWRMKRKMNDGMMMIRNQKYGGNN